MIQREYRSHNTAELETLRARASGAQWKPLDSLGPLLLTAILLCGGGWVVGQALDRLLSGVLSTAVFAPALALCGALWTTVSTVRAARRQRERAGRLQRELELSIDEGRVEVIECDATNAAVLDEFDDEGPGFFLEVAPQVLLFLRGHFTVNDGQPPRRVVLVRDVLSGVHLDVRQTGRLEPQRRLASNKYGGVDWLRSGMFIRGSVDELPEDILNLPESRDVRDDVCQAVHGADHPN